MKECTHKQLHYMGKGPLPEGNSDCRWNYVCRECRVWMKFKRPIMLDSSDRYKGACPRPDYIAGPNQGLDFGVPRPTKLAKKKAVKRKRTRK